MNGSVGTNAAGTEAPAPRCNIYNCPRDSTHTVQLPASSLGRAAAVSLCRPCYSDWGEHTDFDRLRGNVDLVRARPPQGPGGGMAAVERDVIAVPPDKDAKRLVKAIRDNVTFNHGEAPYQLQSRLLIAQDNIERLAVLLDERDAAAAELVTALSRAQCFNSGIAGIGTKCSDAADYLAERDLGPCEACQALDRVKGGS